jgi:hypothetical protein
MQFRFSVGRPEQSLLVLSCPTEGTKTKNNGTKRKEETNEYQENDRNGDRSAGNNGPSVRYNTALKGNNTPSLRYNGASAGNNDPLVRYNATLKGNKGLLKGNNEPLQGNKQR